MARRRAPWRREKLGSALEKGKGVERGRARLLHGPKGRKQAREEARRGRLSLHGVAVALRRPSSACVQGTATRGGSRSSRKAPGARRGLGRGKGAARGRRRDGERRHGENREGDGGDGIAVIRSKFIIRFAISIFLLLYGLK